MTRKVTKAKRAKRSAKKRAKAKSEKLVDAIEVRKEISKMVTEEAVDMLGAVIGQGKTGQLATVRYLFEMAGLYPASADGSQATAEEESLAKTLLRRLNIPIEPVIADQLDEPSDSAIPAMRFGDDEEPDPKDSEQSSGATVTIEEKNDLVLVGAEGMKV